MSIFVSFIPFDHWDNACNVNFDDNCLLEANIHLTRLTSLEQAIEQIPCCPTDVCIICVSDSAVIASLDHITMLRELSPHTQIMVLCERSITNTQILLLLGYGAIGYLYWPVNTQGIIAGIQRACKQEAIVDKEIALLLLKVMERRSESEDGLSQSESEALKQLARNNVLPTSSSQTLYSPEAIQSHLGNILTKYWNVIALELSETAKRARVSPSALIGQTVTDLRYSAPEPTFSRMQSSNKTQSTIELQRQVSPFFVWAPPLPFLPATSSGLHHGAEEAFTQRGQVDPHCKERSHDRHEPTGTGILKLVQKVFTALFLDRRHDRR